MENAKVKYKNSMVFKIQVLLGLGIILTVAILLLIAIPKTTENVRSVTQDYMIDEAKSYGQLIQSRIASDGTAFIKNPSYLGQVLGAVKIGDHETSYAYLVDKDGTMLYHPTADKIGQPVENAVVKGIVADIGAGKTIENKCVEYEFKGSTKYASCYVPKDHSFIMIVTVDEADVFSDINSMTTMLITTGIAAFVLLTVAGILAAGRMVKPLKKLTGVVNQVAGLDFAIDEKQQAELNKRKDETGMISKAIDNLHSELSDIVGVIKKQGEQLADSNQKFGNTFADIAESVSNVDIAVEGIAQGSTSQAQETTSANEQVIDIGNAIEANADSVNVLDSSVKKMTELSSDVAGVLEELTEINAKTSENIETVSAQTGKTNESAGKIKEALAMIQDIAEQTNLLSLNASIEAARAGEAGKGFAVVAEQIRKLSEDSSASARTIEDIVKELIANSEDSVAKMKQVTTDADIQHGKLEATKESFDSLRSEVNSVSYASKDIFIQTEKLEKLKNQVSMAVEQLAAISEENAASTQETSASMQTLTCAIDECKDETEMLSELSNRLNEQTGKFKF